MAQFQFEQEAPRESTVLGTAGVVLDIVVRLLGVALLIVGLWLALTVVREAWSLYEQPERIARFAHAVDDGSNIDKLLAPHRTAPAEAVSAGPAAGDERIAPPAASAGDAAAADEAVPPLRLSYFLAWVIAILLLLLLGRIALGAVKIGGELALFDTNVRRFARALLSETHKRTGAR